MLVKLSAGDESFAGLLARQTPSKSRSWHDVRFAINEPVERCDWWVVCHGSGLTIEESTICDPSHIVFISMEPPAWGCPRNFYNQFSHLVTCDRRFGHPGLIPKNGITWWVGLKVEFDNGHKISADYAFDYDSLSALEPPNKADKISVITSGAKHFPGHETRLRFLDKLATNQISNYIDFFGGYTNPVLDKMDALLPYKYHIALENSVVPDYWTEKLADPILAWCMTAYYGCPNIGQYFPPSSYAGIDIKDFEGTLRILWELLEGDCYANSIRQLSAARSLVLNDYNIFQLIADICKDPASGYELCSLRPLSVFAARDKRLDRRIVRKIGSFMGALNK